MPIRPVLMLRSWLLLCLVMFSQQVYAQEDRAFFWRLSKGDTQAYLMGSVHFADQSFYPLREVIEQAYDASTHLVVEVDVSNMDHAEFQRLMISRGIYKDGTDLRQVLSEETWLQLRQRLKTLDIDYENVKHYKPGMLVLMLTSAHVIRMGFAPDLGIDMYFLKRANADANKQVIELETTEQQMNLFLNIPDAELLLKESLYSLDESELLMAEMVRYWKTGDDENMNRLLFEDALEEYPNFTAIYDELFYRRNETMTSKIVDLIANNGVYFIVVGSGHLIGDRGIVSDLKKLGYKVERL